METNFDLSDDRFEKQFRELMASHYGMDIYHSAKAKQDYPEPDLLLF